jgi:hypothetical protein
LIDKALMLRKLTELDTYLTQIEEYRAVFVEQYRADWRIQRIIRKNYKESGVGWQQKKAEAGASANNHQRRIWRRNIRWMLRCSIVAVLLCVKGFLLFLKLFVVFFSSTPGYNHSAAVNVISTGAGYGAVTD